MNNVIIPESAKTRDPLQHLRTYDCFTMLNELDLLEIRLEELWDVVDYFVITEAETTFSLNKKELNFMNNLKRFEKYMSKIIYLSMDQKTCIKYSNYETPDDQLTNFRRLERAQKSWFYFGIKETVCKPHDYILLGDIDEIPSKEAVIESKKRGTILPDQLRCFSQILHYYYMNAIHRSCLWMGTHMLHWGYIKSTGDSNFVFIYKQLRFVESNDVIMPGGWHFAYMSGNANEIKYKTTSFCHSEEEAVKNINIESINKSLVTGTDLFGRPGPNWKFVDPYPDYLPKYVLNNMNKFSNFFKNMKSLDFNHILFEELHNNGYVKSLDEWYNLSTQKPSDIQMHLPVLYRYASYCDSVTEFGVRNGISTISYLKATKDTGKPIKIVAYDLEEHVYTIENLRILAKNENINFEFKIGNTLQIEIEETDFLFIDTLHTYEQLKKELEIHHTKVKKYIGFHDIITFGFIGEDGTTPGLKQAIDEFIALNTQWKVDYSTDQNNGLLILKK